MVDAGISELRSAFNAQRRPAEAVGPTDCLLEFYAAECGLKAAFLRRRKLLSTGSLSPELKERGHDLVAWAKDLRLPATLMQVKPQVKLRRDGTSIAIRTAHQAWRYGIQLSADDETALRKWLAAVCDWAVREALR